MWTSDLRGTPFLFVYLGKCPGIDSKAAGKADACSNCPNRNNCLSRDNESVNKVIESSIDEIKSRLGLVKHKIIVLSGKGGVGKNADICGPSLPRMMGVENAFLHKNINGWSPVVEYLLFKFKIVKENLCLISSSFIADDEDKAFIWYGDKKTGILLINIKGLIVQFLRDVDWPRELDYMIIDTPPGTSDEHLSLIRYLGDVDGVVIVTTPQELSLVDVKKQINFCRKIGLNIIGLVENMSSFCCTHCLVNYCLLLLKKCSNIFPQDSCGGETMAKEMEIKYLGSIPLDANIGDSLSF
ncbi:cytosolic Fe-S cluster assembly factor nubp1-B-like [Octopus sinensis]|uniref:Cytosolic Fe-S cluster assembly factor nubp1-B-like n=1 Tax=Octopus sinensis TaxID=2607531 RepID=A0A6P7TYQ8_9MOLL|nr:cytosolic Fe-S cluster assembly factor nubp1-B-like [Octopus sinensis]